MFVVTTSVVIRVQKAIAFFTPHISLHLKLPIRQGVDSGFFCPVRSNDFSRYPRAEGDRLLHALPWDCSCYG
ncbi:hypothetical protein [Oscillatoria sp. HE19RPO]|uniref:hypothetical protein n=1 Tax=Oscillatoria sp. HE19RPO TaxID=2954806 RepID=UPI0020C2305A|nr:hypothetical protein [Oscillatoria sp. HE19RPO]